MDLRIASTMIQIDVNICDILALLGYIKQRTDRGNIETKSHANKLLKMFKMLVN